MKVGEVWIDNDKRMDNRTVKITHVDAANGWVRYSPCNPYNGWVSSLSYRSMMKRFPKAFRPSPSQGDSQK